MIPYELQRPRILLPIAATLKTYQKKWIRRDIVAGVTVAAVAVPQAMAYAQLAGVPLIVGLYTTLLVMLVFALFTTSKQVIAGPDAAMAALTGAVVIPIAANNDLLAAALASVLAILMGIACLIGVFARLGFVAEFLSRPILLGYMAGLALAVIASQAPKLFGLPVPADLNFFGMVLYVLTNLTHASMATIFFSTFFVAVGLAFQRYVKVVPASLVILIGSIALSIIFDFDDHGIAVVGTIPTGIPLPQFPGVELHDIQDLIIPAMAIMMVSYANTVATARSFAAKQRERINASQEFFGLGVANIASGVFGGMPAAASGARTAVNHDSRAKTQVSQLFGAAVVAIVLLVLAPLLRYLPISALAVIIVLAVSRLFDYAELRSIWHAWRSEALLAIMTVIGVTFLGILQGLLLAVFLAIANLIRKSAFPSDAELGIGEDGQMHDLQRASHAKPLPGLVMYRFDAPLYFANANHFRERVLLLIDSAQQPVQWFLWDAETITSVDSTAAQMLLDLIDELRDRHITFAVARVKGPLQTVVTRSHRLSRAFARMPHFSSIGLALDAFRESQTEVRTS